MSELPDEAVAFLREHVGDTWTVEPLPGDASVRRYFRIRLPDASTRMLAYYPREVRPQLEQFLNAYRVVQPHGRVPEVLQHSDAAVLQSDVGNETLFDLLHHDRDAALVLYRSAIDALVAFQRAGHCEVNPPFSSDFFFNELEMTRAFYVDALMGETEESSRALIPLFRRLTDSLAHHPYVLCHRDYHGQNIHIINGTLFIIDYQDMRMGPDTYDMASLLRDRGVARLIGDDAEMDLLAYYAALRNADGNLRTRYFETLLQRSLKILGTFSRQPIERGRLHYLEFIPPTLESIERCLGELPEFSELSRVFPLRFSLEAAEKRVKGDLSSRA
ncbi:MAG TPA: phosphotransferase [Thermoanaerobaculia bacterium]|nr:phosphotransferase [Thermoanaerobaculia bacterium]